MRIKNRWFKEGREPTPQALAGAVAFTAWRLAENLLKNLRRADFEVAVGPQYFALLAETLIFVFQVSCRLAWQSLNEAARPEFANTLALRIAENLSENRARLLGGDASAHRAAFIDLLNLRSGDYAEFGFDIKDESFSFKRYFAHSLSQHLDEKDRHWVSDQVIAIEAPEIAETIDRALKGLTDKTPRPRRAANGAGGD